MRSALLAAAIATAQAAGLVAADEEETQQKKEESRRRQIPYTPWGGTTEAPDTIAPTIVITSTVSGATAAAFTCTFTFSEDVSGFIVGDITVANGSAGTFNTVSASVYTAVITPTALGTVTVDVGAGVCMDAAGNANEAATQFSILYLVAALWLDFSDIATLYQTNDTSTPVTANGQTIGYVADKSGNARDATQATVGLRPLYAVNQQNGLSGALYDGSNDALNTASFSQAQPNTYVLVAKYTGIIGTNSGAYFDGLGTRQQVWVVVGANPPPDGTSIYAGSTVTNTVDATNNTAIKSIIFNGASSKTWVDGVADITTGNPGANGLNAGLQIGYSSTIPFKGPYMEFLLFSGALSDANRVLVQNYLNTKWAVF